MLNFSVVILLIVIITGCKKFTTEYSDTLNVSAVVINKQYIPEDDGLALGVAMGNPALGVAMSDDEHNYIIFEGDGLKIKVDDREIFNSFNVNDQVDIAYREVYRTEIDEDGKKIGRTLVDYQLVSAQLRN